MSDEAIGWSRQESAGAEGRQIIIEVVAPLQSAEPSPLIIFSHGANATPARYKILLEAWARAGAIVAAPMHVDSEEHPERGRYDRASGRRLRMEDYATVDRLARDAALALPPGLALSQSVAAAGHSYGALIAQVAGGAELLGREHEAFRWRHPAAVVALSPPPPMPGLIDAAGWARVRAPHLCVTGTADVLPGLADRWEQHLAAHWAIDASLSLALVFPRMDHYFNGAFGRLGPNPPVAEVRTLNEEIGAFLAKARSSVSGATLGRRKPHILDA